MGSTGVGWERFEYMPPGRKQKAESSKQLEALTRMLPPRAELSLLPRPGFVAFPGVVPAPFLILR